MTIVVPGGTKCVSCGNVIQKNQDVIGWPAFVANRADPLYKFSDAVAHRSCFDREPMRDAVLQRLELIDRLRVKPNSEASCRICGRKMTFDDYFEFPFLTSDKHHKAYKLNCMQLHRTCLSKWDKIEQVRHNIRSLNTQWDTETLEAVLRALPTHHPEP